MLAVHYVSATNVGREYKAVDSFELSRLSTNAAHH